MTKRESEIGNGSGAPARIRTPNQQIMRRFEGHQQGETKRDEAVFTESAAVKVRYVSLRLSTPSRHYRAIDKHQAGVVISAPNFRGLDQNKRILLCL